MELGLEGKVASVTGCVRGIGPAIVVGSVKEDASVVVAGIRPDETLKLVDLTIGR